MYDQTKDKRTKRSCTIYTMLNILKYDFGVVVKDSMIYKIVAYMESIGALLPNWAYFAVIYPAMCKLINMKEGINLKVKTSYISKWLDDKSMWGLWFLKLSRLSIKLSQDNWLTIWDIQEIAKSGTWSWHNHAVKQSNLNVSWKIVDSWGADSYTTSLAALKEGVLLWVYYDRARTIVPADLRTEKIQVKCVNQAKKMWRFLTYREFTKIKKSIK